MGILNFSMAVCEARGASAFMSEWPKQRALDIDILRPFPFFPFPVINTARAIAGQASDTRFRFFFIYSWSIDIKNQSQHRYHQNNIFNQELVYLPCSDSMLLTRSVILHRLAQAPRFMSSNYNRKMLIHEMAKWSLTLELTKHKRRQTLHGDDGWSCVSALHILLCKINATTKLHTPKLRWKTGAFHPKNSKINYHQFIPWEEQHS